MALPFFVDLPVQPLRLADDHYLSHLFADLLELLRIVLTEFEPDGLESVVEEVADIFEDEGVAVCSGFPHEVVSEEEVDDSVFVDDGDLPPLGVEF